MPDQLPIEIIDALLRAVPEAALIVGSDSRLIAANPAASSLLPSLRPGELLVRGLRSPDILDALTRAFARRKPQKVQWLERVPVERLFDVHIAPIEFADGPRMVMLTLRDLSEIRRAERMRVDFVTNVSHELRTPLTSVLGFVETLQGPARNDPVARERFLAIMGEQARRMSRLVDDLLSLSRIEQSAHLQPTTVVDLSSVASHVIDTLATMADENETQVLLNSEEPVLVRGDRDELVRVAENLIENAIKYGASGKPVEVSVVQRGGDGVLIVRDHGPGIAPEHLPRLTERFYRVDTGESRAKGGTGLGLAIVKHILTRHRGRLTIDSLPGQGATFSAVVPLGEPQGQES
ncbi:MAG: two-component system, OmpR family, phosphate regulon sensor histidine kinase PhoR [Methylobacteriaceae bacterium]|jgi:two-component system phosphate regulon sensor histidine kinase PhoR|nr:two-component system, OmpR family, phosphate regulon sensor histidine kinase PhoR [Methylobacteriaceae bacterium]